MNLDRLTLELSQLPSATISGMIARAFLPSARLVTAYRLAVTREIAAYMPGVRMIEAAE